MLKEHILDVTAANGVPFRVVYGVRDDIHGKPLTQYGDVVAFYDRRHKGSPHGQFVSDYQLDTLAKRDRAYALNLYGGVADWVLDAATMNFITCWVETFV